MFKSLKMVEAIGMPTMGEACEPFVFEFVEAIFGAQDPDTGRRLITEFLLLISKKNGKSTIAAGIMLTALILNYRPGQGLLILAPTIQIADNSFGVASKMVRADPDLAIQLKVVEHQRQIEHMTTKATLKVVAADANVVGGTKAGFILVDELWLFGKNAKAKAMLEEATGGMAARPEGFLIYLTTHSDEPPAGVFKSKLRYFRDVRDGVIDDPASLGVLYEWPEEMLEGEAYLDPANYYVTNPNIGKSPTVDFIAAKIRKAQGGEFDDGEDSLQIILAKYLNVEIGLRLRRDRWRGADFWEDSADKTLTFETLLDRCEVVVVGIDGGGSDDLYGLCIAGRERGAGRWLFWNHAWARLDVLERRKDIAPTLRDFAELGEVTICDEAEFDEDAAIRAMAEGREIEALTPPDIAQVVAIVSKIMDRGLLPATYGIGIDPAGAPLTLDALNRLGLADETIMPVGQGYRLNPAIVMLPRMLKAGTARHAGQKLMNWCVGNAKAIYAGSALVVSKQVNGSAKIDPLSATFNAFMLLARHPRAAGAAKSFWEEV